MHTHTHTHENYKGMGDPVLFNDRVTMQKWYGGDAEDNDDSMHPPGCRFAPGRISILDCPLTWNVVVVGGLSKVEEAILELEEYVDNSNPYMRIGDPGMNIGQNCSCLFCEICGKHSVVSWENYSRVVGRLSLGESSSNWEDGPSIGMHPQIQHPADYYLFMAMTRDIHITPYFHEEADESESCTSMNMMMMDEMMDEIMMDEDDDKVDNNGSKKGREEEEGKNTRDGYNMKWTEETKEARRMQIDVKIEENERDEEKDKYPSYRINRICVTSSIHNHRENKKISGNNTGNNTGRIIHVESLKQEESNSLKLWRKKSDGEHGENMDSFMFFDKRLKLYHNFM